MSQKYLFHGSKKELDEIKPTQAYGFGGESDCQMAVYAVENMSLAVFPS